MTDTPEPVDSAPAGVDPSDAPSAMDGPFDPDLYRNERRQQHTRGVWEHMVTVETQIRTLEAGVSQVKDSVGNVGLMLVDRETRRAATRVARKEAARLRRVVGKLLEVNEVDEMALVVQRAANLADYIAGLERNLIDHQELRDFPQLYGHATVDQLPIDQAQNVRNITIIEVALADAKAELAYYASRVMEP